MRIESALFASREGLQVHGQAISVIGDNIANSNTTAFKESRIEFSDLLPEGSNGRQSTTTANTGTGVQVSAIRTIYDNGVIEFTGRELDLAIEGNGFFMTGETADPVYSRAGNLTIDANGLLATAQGQPILGFQGSATTLSTINMEQITTTSSPTTKTGITGNLNTADVVKTAPANPASFTELKQGSNFINNLSVFDSQGVSHDITVALTKTGTNTWVAQAYIDGGDVGGTAGTPVQLGQNATLSFGSDGLMTDVAKANAIITATPAYGNGAAAGNFTIDMGSFTQFGAQSQVASITKDGQGVGQVLGYEFAKDGTITARLSSGTTVTVGKIQLADFKNRDGLIRAGDSGYKPTELAGDPVTGSPLELGFGGVQGGSLERSTVDIANQFVNLVVYQRGYQANSQTLNAASQIIRDTLGLIR